ncbi:MAG: type II toxin-antitoxin system RelE/ParE family toxin [Spartobacteria bacterium]|nr:type II toxin-antitoxin system RelE/ParE family toxin [Spartobacteria bacterium]
MAGRGLLSSLQPAAHAKGFYTENTRPANQLEALSGKRKGQHSIRINRQWRICFNWKDGNAYNVEIVDCH